MARPRQPLIDRLRVVEKALEIIDRDGLEAVSIRRIGSELRVDGTSLYHHFADKEAIVHGVRLRILQEGHVGERAHRYETWQDYVRRTTAGYRRSLLRHPNAAPLLAPTELLRPFSLRLRGPVPSGQAPRGRRPRRVLVYPIIDSVETLAYASALLNPLQEGAKVRLTILPEDDVPALERAVSAAPPSPGKVFLLQLQAVIDGWTALLEREV